MTVACQYQTINGQSCVVCPEQPYIAPTPEQRIIDPRYGWNASAYSVERREGDCYTQFSMPPCMAAAVGFAASRLSSDPRDIPHAFYIYRNAGAEYWVVLEAGVPITAPVLRVPETDEFRIERRGSTVTYFHNGKTKHVSAVPTAVPLVVVGCMYAAEDGVD